MIYIRKFRIPIIVVIVHLIVVLYFNAILPPEIEMPRQWNLNGEVVSHSSRSFGLWFLWGMNAFLLVFFILFPYIDPRYKKHKGRFKEMLPSLMRLMTLFLLLIHVYQLLWTIEVPLVRNFNGILFIVGFLFILLGNILPKIPSNFFAGFRSPWTLSSEKVWKKTHRLGGYCFVISGILMIIRGFIPDLSATASIIYLIVAFGICLYPYPYSYILFVKERNGLKKMK